MTTIEPICFTCKHFDIETSTCAAFPVEIPEDILVGNDDHAKPLPDQGNKIVYEKAVPSA